MAIIQAKDLVEGDLFELLGLKNIPESQKEELMTKIIEGVESRVMLRIDDLLEEADHDHFNKILDQGNDQAITDFLQGKNINVGQLATEEVLLMKSEILQTAQAIKE